MSTIAELGTFLERESEAANRSPAKPANPPTGSTNGELVTADRQQESRPVASAPDNA